MVSWLGEPEFLCLARAAEHHDERPQLQQGHPEPEPETEQPQQDLRICVFAEQELRTDLAAGVEWVGGVELMEAILAVRVSHGAEAVQFTALTWCGALLDHDHIAGRRQAAIGYG